MRLCSCVPLLLTLTACGPKAQAADPSLEILEQGSDSTGNPSAPDPASSTLAPRTPTAHPPSRWSEVTATALTRAVAPEKARLLEPCAELDQGLMDAAQQMAEHLARGQGLADNDEVVFETRVAGVAQVWPRVWALVGERDTTKQASQLSDWLASFNDGGKRRCGVGLQQGPAGPAVVALALDAIAELEPVPRRARVGQWVEIQAPLLVSASKAEVVALGPRGAPFSVPTSLSSGVVHARVPVDAPGPWLIQVLPTLDSGPRPAAEALIYVDQEPPDKFQSSPVPGEDQGTGNDSNALLAMLNGARLSERLGALKLNPRLTRAAEKHATRMLESGRVAHDLGDGDPAERVAREGLTPRITGENVAHADTLVRAHRALWSSPSHRGNLLLARFTEVGIGVAERPGSGVWVCEVFGAF
ncbi:MAG TPA: CAP domain-containing protein [Polyangiaceae bacterium]|nr:CAP domain-containing protein [Polyangiaceae bacterium]